MNVLLVIDMQVGVYSKERYDAGGTLDRINTLIDAVRESGGQVVFIRHCTEHGLEKGSDAWQILPELDQRDSDVKVDKISCSAFCRTELEDVLKRMGTRKLLISGCCTDFCVDTTVREAAGLGYETIVAADCHTTADKPYMPASSIIQHHNFVWSNFDAPGPEIEVMPLADVLTFVNG